MRRSRKAALLALLPGVLLISAASSAHTSDTATSLTMTLTEANGSPMTGASLSVYYFPPVITDGTQLKLMGSATSDATGTAALSLNTSMVPAADLGDNGDGTNDAFNTVVIGFDPAGHEIIRHEVVTENHIASDSARALVGTNGQPLLGTPINRVADPHPAPTSDGGVVGTDYRYVQVLAANSGDGMSTKLDYTYTSSTGRQTDIESALENIGAGWIDAGGMMEETDRSTDAPWYHKGVIHQYIWASYQFYEYHFEGCGRFSCYNYYEWEPNHFEGSTTDFDTDHWKSGGVIGPIAYKVPAFTYGHGQGSYWFPLVPENTGWGRDSGTRQTYSYQLNVAGFISLRDWATYGSITSQHYWYQSSGCSAPNERILWGNGVDPEAARIVQANCIDPATARPRR